MTASVMDAAEKQILPDEKIDFALRVTYLCVHLCSGQFLNVAAPEGPFVLVSLVRKETGKNPHM